MKVNIYKITNKVNDKIYVGKTIHDINHRFYQHKQNAKNGGSCMLLYNAIRKYGEENFEISLIDSIEDNWEYWEQYYINKYKAHYSEGGYNITHGGDANPMDDPVALKHFYDKISSLEHKDKVRKSLLGRKIPKSVSSKWGEKQKVVQNKPEVKQKVIMNQPNRFSVKMLDENENVLKEFVCCSDALRYLGIPLKEAGAVKYACDKYNKNGKRKRLFGYYWTKSDL